MKTPKPIKLLEFAVYLLILVLPVIVLHWLTPFQSDITIGNDYGIFPIQQQMELNYSQEKGTFPLYTPGFAEGRSQAALTMGQLFHPISHLARMTPGYWDGDALTINTMYKFIGLAITHLVLFIFLRRLTLGIGPALLLSFVAVYNMRMLDLFRYGASLENYLGYLLLCASMGFLFVEKNRKPAAVAAVISTYLLICGGHPQMMYLGMLGAGLFTMLFPFCVAALIPELKEQLHAKPLLRYFGWAAAAIALGILLSSPYIFSFYFEFIADNALRVGREYEWSLAYQDTIGGALNSLFLPVHADVHGAFGSSPLIVLVPLIPLAFILGIRVPVGVVVTSLLCILIFLASTGDATPIHYGFWKYVPLAQTFRVPGRLTMMLPALLMLAMTWLFAPVQKDALYNRFSLPFNRLLLPALVAVILYYVYHNSLLAELPEPSRYTPTTIVGEKMRDRALLEELQNVAMPRAYQLGFITLILSLLYAVHIKWKPQLWKGILAVLLIAAVVTQVTTELRYGTWQKAVTPSKTLTQMDEEKEKALTFSGSPGFGMESPQVTTQMEKSILPVQMSQFYRRYVTASSQEDAYAQIRLHRRSNVAVVEGKAPEAATETSGIDRVTLTTATFNKVTFQVDVNAAGVLTFEQPFDGRWRAMVDDADVSVLRVNGIENGVLLTSGQHEITFWYRSAATWTGVLVSLLVAFGIAAGFLFVWLRGKKRIPVIAAAGLFFAGLFICFISHLYNGENLNTQFRWDSGMFSSPDNVAFGKPTAMSSIRSNQMPYFYYSGLAVDGDVTGRGFVTNPGAQRPWWQVDLGEVRNVGVVRIYNAASLLRHRPLNVLTATDGGFQVSRTVSDIPRGRVMELDLQGTAARYIRLQSAGRGTFSLPEVEVYEYKGPVIAPLTDETDPTGNLRHQQGQNTR
ncbi:MAG: hypothetical protein JXX29_21330 [Deltaproteobacteria bacterium]|nr:hypothetical protein [Deltaproteobacteria bacterium]MBN2674239.1 hypothetical protein [Deltaproteobacteria bacterium]